MRGFLVRLTDEQRGGLEALRQKLGLRSESEAVRWLIDRERGAPMPEIVTHAVLRFGSPAPEALKGAKKAPTGGKIQYEPSSGLPIGPITPKPGARLKK